jgi:hypothetical protein
MNHCTRCLDNDIGPLGMTVISTTGPRFSFLDERGLMHGLHVLRARQHVLAGRELNGRRAS